MKNETNVAEPLEVEATAVAEMPKPRKERPPVIPTPRKEDVTGRKPIKLNFHVGKEFMRKFEIPQVDSRKKVVTVYHMYPLLSEWIGRTAPDGVNPRSHDPECLKSPVAKAIESTILERPEDFFLANRGSTLIVDEVNYNPQTGYVELVINDPENQGIADGATTDAVIAKVQTAFAREYMERKDANYTEMVDIKNGKLPESLKNGRLHLEIITDLDDRERLASLVQGRNTSRQVRGWSMADFKGNFDWLKEVIDVEGSPLFDRVGYEENSSKDVTVLDVLSVITLFHPEYDQKDDNGGDKAPTVAYANKGRMDARLMDDELLKGYKALIPVIPDIVQLHDYIYANFESAYDKVHKGKSRLGRRRGVESRLQDKPLELPMTGMKSSYVIPAGFIFPILASFRALVSHKGKGAHWRLDPFEFFDKYGKVLVAELMEQVDAQGGNPNVAGKRKLVYTALYSKARNCMSDELDEKRGK